MSAFRIEDLPIESQMLTSALDEAQRKVGRPPLSVRLFLPHRQELFWSLFCSVLYSTLQKGGRAGGQAGGDGASPGPGLVQLRPPRRCNHYLQ